LEFLGSHYYGAYMNYFSRKKELKKVGFLKIQRNKRRISNRRAALITL
jgi:hypothetical protein